MRGLTFFLDAARVLRDKVYLVPFQNVKVNAVKNLKISSQVFVLVKVHVSCIKLKASLIKKLEILQAQYRCD
jgi:hypothetical protein